MARNADTQLVLRFAALNLCAYPNRGWRPSLAELLASVEPDVVLLQEVRRSWVEPLEQITGLSIVHSHDASPRLAGAPPDGVAIGVRAGIAVRRSWRIEPEDFEPARVAAEIDESTPSGHEVMPPRLAARYALRTLFSELSVSGRSLVVATLHATPGTSRVRLPDNTRRRVREWKTFFHGAAAIALRETRLPFVFAIDANEPRSETLDGSVFHCADRPGVKKLQALLGQAPIHRGRDLLREIHPPRRRSTRGCWRVL